METLLSSCKVGIVGKSVLFGSNSSASIKLSEVDSGLRLGRATSLVVVILAVSNVSKVLAQ